MEQERVLLPNDQEWHGRHENWTAVGTLIETLENSHLPAELPPDDGWYGWEPLPVLDFMEGITSVIELLARNGLKHAAFLDVGSGIGSKLALAASFGLEAVGVERHRPYAEVSRRIFPDVVVTEVEAHAFDHYGSFDIIYCYRMAKEESLQADLNHHIVEQMCPGALFWCIGPPWPDWLEHVGGYLWRK